MNENDKDLIKLRAKCDQAAAAVSELAPLMYVMFSEYKKAGFTEDQALELVSVYIR